MKKNFFRWKGVLCVLTVLACAGTVFGVSVEQAPRYYSESELIDIAQNVIKWKIRTTDDEAVDLSDADISSADSILSKNASAGNDWFVIALSKLYPEMELPLYLEQVLHRAASEYLATDPADAVVTEFHRYALTILALGGDPTVVNLPGKDSAVNLIEAFTYNRGHAASLGKHGINGWIWALIVLDSCGYIIPENAFYQREDMIREMLSLQKENGGFALAGDIADPDITAMVLQALAPYYESDEPFTYFREAAGKNVTASIGQSMDEAIAFLSERQLETGDYRSFGNTNVQTGAQVLIALACIGSDPQKRNDFIKSGVTLVDGMLRYQMSDGGFAHILSVPVSNEKAGEQVLGALTALLLNMRGDPGIYRFSSDAKIPSSEAEVSQADSIDRPAKDGFPIPFLVALAVLLPFSGVSAYYCIRKKRLIMLWVILAAAVVAGGFFYRLEIRSPDHYYSSNPDSVASKGTKAYLLIDCAAALTDPSRLPAGLRDFDILPQDGVILPKTAYEITEGESAFDLLLKATRLRKIQMDFRGDPARRTGAIYVKSIGHLYEFDCGPLSGWLFKVNGKFSDGDSSKVTLNDGDVVEWLYTCDLGRDIGNDFGEESDAKSGQAESK